MGWTSEMVAQTYSISREKQDHYAYISHSRAEKVPEIVAYLPAHPNRVPFDSISRHSKLVNSHQRSFLSK